MSEPTIACRTPPWLKPSLGPTPLMSWVKKFRCSSGCQPRATTKTTVLTTAAPTTSAAPVITDSATRSFTSTRPPLIDAVTAVTARPSTNQAMRNHGSPPSGSSRWVTSQASPRPRQPGADAGEPLVRARAAEADARGRGRRVVVVRREDGRRRRRGVVGRRAGQLVRHQSTPDAGAAAVDDDRGERC